jgi:uncharacterized GH25 family protein
MLARMEGAGTPLPSFEIQNYRYDLHLFQNGGNIPQTYKEKMAFKESIKSKKRDGSDAENFEEALTSYYRACTMTKVYIIERLPIWLLMVL